jgi:drug/metabolite transporter (DMT)-like permease
MRRRGGAVRRVGAGRRGSPASWGALRLAGLPYVGAAIAMLPVLHRRWPSRQALARSRSRLAVAVVLGGAVGPLLLAAGLGYVSAATASLLLNLELVFTTAVAATLFRDHIALRTKRARRT